MSYLDIRKHMAIVGETQSGKTYLADKMFRQTGGLFIDFEDVGDISCDVETDRTTDYEKIKNGLDAGKRVCYIPSETRDRREKEIEIIWRKLKKLNRNITVYADEIQEYGGDTKNRFDKFAVRGLKYGIHLIPISQRPAWISKTIATQSPKWIFFDVGDFERRYFREYQLPFGKLQEKLEGAGNYSFVIYERGELVKGPFKIS